MTRPEANPATANTAHLAPFALFRSAFIAFYRIEDDFYCTICWTSPRYRGRRCFARLVDWLKNYAQWHGVKRLAFDVHHDNEAMVRIMERHCEKTFVRYNLGVECQ